jgi:hypothetical protein
MKPIKFTMDLKSEEKKRKTKERYIERKEIKSRNRHCKD